MVEPENKRISIVRQCELLGIARSGIYYQRGAEKEEEAILMRLLDEQYTLTPFYDYRRMTHFLREQGYKVNGKRVLRLMKKLVWKRFIRSRIVQNREQSIFDFRIGSKKLK